MNVLRLLLLSLATLGSMSALPARADVVPEGQRYIPVEHTLTGTASVKDLTLLLVTVNGRNRQQADAVPIVADGPLPVPSGYMNRSYLVALTAAQVKEMEAAREAGRVPGQESQDSPLRKFFQREDVAASDELFFRGLVADDSAARSIKVAWTLSGVANAKLTLTGTETHVDAAGQPLSRGGSFPIVLVLAAGGVIVASALFVFLRRKPTS